MEYKKRIPYIAPVHKCRRKYRGVAEDHLRLRSPHINTDTIQKWEK
jgi:hypothetical protein